MKYKLTVIIPVYNQETLVIRAIESIPKREDIEIIVIDDDSKDNTWINLIDYRENQRDLFNLILLKNDKNEGVAYTVNKGLDYASGEYVVLLGSDDYFITEMIHDIMEIYLNGTDLVYFNLETNDGTIFRVDQESSRNNYVGSVKFMRRKFIGETRNPTDKRAREDYYFYQELLKKKPTEIYTGLVAKHYNFPREGSLTDLALKGII